MGSIVSHENKMLSNKYRDFFLYWNQWTEVDDKWSNTHHMQRSGELLSHKTS